MTSQLRSMPEVDKAPEISHWALCELASGTPSWRELSSVARMILLPFALLEHEIRRDAQTQIASEREPDGSSADSQNRQLHRSPDEDIAPFNASCVPPVPRPPRSPISPGPVRLCQELMYLGLKPPLA
jgi:hypothetical protein